MIAPLQGLTEAAWRGAHFSMFGDSQGEVEYFTPFIREEKGVARARDMREFSSGLNRGIMLTPQIIFRDVDEWSLLVDSLAAAGATRIDMNLGCPFVPQVRKGRGAGMLSSPDRLMKIADAMAAYTGSLEFSVKMRLGVSDPAEAQDVAAVINDMPLRHVAIHPRTAAQQYKGALLLDDMERLMTRLRHPVVYNGEITTPQEIDPLTSRYAGVMVGRGLLARPSLFAEWRTGRLLTPHEHEEAYLTLLGATASELEKTLCGEAQLRDKMKPYWEYVPATLDKKIVKQGRKHGLIPAFRHDL